MQTFAKIYRHYERWEQQSHRQFLRLVRASQELSVTGVRQVIRTTNVLLYASYLIPKLTSLILLSTLKGPQLKRKIGPWEEEVIEPTAGSLQRVGFF